MKKTFFTILVLFATSLGCHAQELLDDDEADDVVSLSEITRAISDNVVGKNDEETKLKSWKRKTFFRISYNKTNFSALDDKLAPDFTDDNGQLMLDGTNAGNEFYDYKSKTAVSIQWGKNISLHKKAIANTVRFSLDFTWIDLNWNNYEASYSEDGMKYDSGKTFIESSDSYSNKPKHFLPWGMQKNEVNYGMSLGPSLTIAPFGSLNNKHLMGIHVQVYYHFGYSASVLFFKNEEGLKTGPDNGWSDAWGHGYNTSYGFNLSWKAIGIGFEKRSWEKIKYKSREEDFGEQKYPFNMKNTRLYLTFNF